MLALKMLRRREGGVLVYTAIAIFLLVGLTALAIDVGQLYVARQRAQNVCDASALAGVWHIDPSNAATLALPDGPAATSAQDCALGNNEDRHWITYHKDDPSLEGVTVSFPTTTSIKTEGQVPVTYLFARIFGLSEKRVSASAVASLEIVDTVYSKLLPIAFPESVVRNAEFGQEAVIKEDAWQESGVGTGNWRPVSFPGDTGGNDYRTRLGGGGEPVQVSIGDMIDTLPGEKLGPTVQGLQDRLDDPAWAEWNGSYESLTSYEPNDRLVLVPVIADGFVHGQTEVEIIGFIGFFVESADKSTKEVTGYFVGSILGSDPDSVRWINWIIGGGGTSRVARPRLVS
ncbi:MAG: pilus assembly protein TadG-related protein [Armatimonadota bacterium]